jgi:hypothetical protein
MRWGQGVRGQRAAIAPSQLRDGHWSGGDCHGSITGSDDFCREVVAAYSRCLWRLSPFSACGSLRRFHLFQPLIADAGCCGESADGGSWRPLRSRPSHRRHGGESRACFALPDCECARTPRPGAACLSAGRPSGGGSPPPAPGLRRDGTRSPPPY